MQDIENRPAARDDLLQLYSIYRSYVEHEDDLINHRVTWFLTSQAFLFTIYGYFLSKTLMPVLGNAATVPPTDVMEQIRTQFSTTSMTINLLIVGVLCYFGYFSGLRSLRSISAGHSAVSSLRKKWESDVLGKPGARHDILPDLTGGGSPYAGLRGWGVSSKFLPQSARWLWAGILLVHVVIFLMHFVGR